jgi:hypothetical protein
VPRLPGAGSDPDRDDEILQFGRDRSGRRRWLPRTVLVLLVVAAGLAVVARGSGHPARRAAPLPAPSQLPAPSLPAPPPVRITSAGHRLLGVTGDWELFARGPDDLVRIQLSLGRLTRTYVPPLTSGNPDVSFVVGASETVIASADHVPGYVVPDGGQARLLTGPLAAGGPLLPGPDPRQAAWVTTGPPTRPALSLVALAGDRRSAVIRLAPGRSQLPATAAPDGRGYALLISGSSTVYDTGPGWDRPVPGTVIAVGPSSWLDVACEAHSRRCHDEVIDAADGDRRTLPGKVSPSLSYLSWPPMGVIAPDGATAAVAEPRRDGQLTVRLIDLDSGAARDLAIRLGPRGSGNQPGTDANNHSMAWSPDSRWLFVAAAGGRLLAVDARSGQATDLGVALPPVTQVAIRR